MRSASTVCSTLFGATLASPSERFRASLLAVVPGLSHVSIM